MMIHSKKIWAKAEKMQPEETYKPSDDHDEGGYDKEEMIEFSKKMYARGKLMGGEEGEEMMKKAKMIGMKAAAMQPGETYKPWEDGKKGPCKKKGGYGGYGHHGHGHHGSSSSEEVEGSGSVMGGEGSSVEEEIMWEEPEPIELEADDEGSLMAPVYSSGSGVT